jgi:hypothetical protein
MLLPVLRILAAVLCAAAVFLSGPVHAQDPKAGERPKAPAGEPAKDAHQRRLDDFAEAARALTGPAGNPECVWLGRRVVNLLWRDDLDTAFRHLDLYDRFGCPSGHIQATFRCVVRQGNIDPKAPESLGTRVQACWINPALQPPPTTATTTQPPAGTSSQ